MGPSDEQGRVGRLWVVACRAADAEDWARAEFVAVELAVGPVALADLIAEAMLLGACRAAGRHGWRPDHGGDQARVAGSPDRHLLDLVVRFDRSRSGGGRRVRPGWLAAWRAATGLPLTEGYVAVLRARRRFALPPTGADDLIA